MVSKAVMRMARNETLLSVGICAFSTSVLLLSQAKFLEGAGCAALGIVVIFVRGFLQLPKARTRKANP